MSKYQHQTPKYCDYDNPATLSRERYHRGEMVGSVTAELIEDYGKTEEGRQYMIYAGIPMRKFSPGHIEGPVSELPQHMASKHGIT